MRKTWLNSGERERQNRRRKKWGKINQSGCCVCQEFPLIWVMNRSSRGPVNQHAVLLCVVVFYSLADGQSGNVIWGRRLEKSASVNGPGSTPAVGDLRAVREPRGILYRTSENSACNGVTLSLAKWRYFNPQTDDVMTRCFLFKNFFLPLFV